MVFYFIQAAKQPNFFFQLLNALLYLRHVSHHHVDQMLNAERKMVLVLAYVHQVSMEIHMIVTEVVTENAKLIMIVHLL